MSAPVAFFIFNRPEATQRVFSEIRKAKPPVLLIVADGPRPGVAEDATKCALAREGVTDIDWPCTVMRNYADTNMGCRLRVSSGLDWVFAQVSEAIILEDDCLPGSSFFRFCEEMLDHFREDERVMSVGGTNMLGKWKADINSYHFTLYGGVWGWATWRRAWQHYDITMKAWLRPDVREKIRLAINDRREYRRRARIFDETVSGKTNTWDFQWNFAHFLHSGLSVVPSVNLVSNIGFGPGATHTTDPRSYVSALSVCSYPFPIIWSAAVEADREFDVTLTAFVSRKLPVLTRIGDAIKIACDVLMRMRKHFLSITFPSWLLK